MLPVLPTKISDCNPSEIYTSTENHVRFSNDDIRLINLSDFILYYAQEKDPSLVAMNLDIDNIVFKLNRLADQNRPKTEDESNEDIQQNIPPADQIKLEKITRALHQIFPEFENKPLNQFVVSQDSVLKVFPPLIKDSPFIASSTLNRRFWALPIQITELFFRTLTDFILLCSLHIYGLTNPDHAEYLKFRLSLTHNNALRAIQGNIFHNCIAVNYSHRHIAKR